MKISAGGVRLEVRVRGPRLGQPLLLLMGLGMQLTVWPRPLIDRLVRRGYRVICFDHRDVGLSQSFDDLGTPPLMQAALRSVLGLPLQPPYTLAEMANDSAALITALGLESAHVCGLSMGGMVAQHLAARHPARVRSLTLMMTTSGARRLPQPSLRVRQALMAMPQAGDPANALTHYLSVMRLIGSPGFPFDEEGLRERTAASIARAFRPQANARQLVAILADGDRSPLLPRIIAPTTVLHGTADPVVPVAAAHDLAAKIPQATVELIEGWGHDLPPAVWPRCVATIEAVAQRWRA